MSDISTDVAMGHGRPMKLTPKEEMNAAALRAIEAAFKEYDSFTFEYSADTGWVLKSSTTYTSSRI